ncbi:MAG: hypothetical protein JRN66_06335 [Nitrososphaerota archaeon]|nr:hypothetical protein [Nitrososphaerota archaeon]
MKVFWLLVFLIIFNASLVVLNTPGPMGISMGQVVGYSSTPNNQFLSYQNSTDLGYYKAGNGILNNPLFIFGDIPGTILTFLAIVVALPVWFSFTLLNFGLPMSWVILLTSIAAAIYVGGLLEILSGRQVSN